MNRPIARCPLAWLVCVIGVGNGSYLLFVGFVRLWKLRDEFFSIGIGGFIIDLVRVLIIIVSGLEASGLLHILAGPLLAAGALWYLQSPNVGLAGLVGLLLVAIPSLRLGSWSALATTVALLLAVVDWFLCVRRQRPPSVAGVPPHAPLGGPNRPPYKR